MPADRVLVTGISGFIAKHCAVELLNAGYRVRGTVRSPAARDAVRATLGNHADVSALEFVEADLLVDEHWAGAVAGCSAVLHVASPFPSSQPKDENVLIRPAVDGTLRVLRAAAAAGVPPSSLNDEVKSGVWVTVCGTRRYSAESVPAFAGKTTHPWEGTGSIALYCPTANACAITADR